jgi:hypothetical protein
MSHRRPAQVLCISIDVWITGHLSKLSECTLKTYLSLAVGKFYSNENTVMKYSTLVSYLPAEVFI